MHDGLAPWLTDLGWVVVVYAHDPESALAEPAVVRQRRADLARADDDDLPFALEAENLPKMRCQLVDGVAKASLAEGPEERKVLSHLRRGGSTKMRELVTGGRLLALSVEIFEVPEVHREASDSRFGDAFHGRVGGL